jgi:hypothetical protein
MPCSKTAELDYKALSTRLRYLSLLVANNAKLPFLVRKGVGAILEGTREKQRLKIFPV